jgi:hypothetical protein
MRHLDAICSSCGCYITGSKDLISLCLSHIRALMLKINYASIYSQNK